MKTDKNILIAFLLNLAFSIFELVGGIFTNSVAILTDSIHDLGDALSIGISYFLEKKSKKKPDKNHTYGYIRYSVIGSIITTVILLVGSCFVIYESIKRIMNPVVVNYDGMIIFAIFGVVINTIASIVTKDGDSLNQRAVNLHMLEDVLGWIVVLIGSILMKFTDIYLIDSILSIGVAIFILFHALKNLKKVLDIFLEVTPKNIDLDELQKHILSVDGVVDVHHIHVRSIDGYNNYATLHIVVKKYSEKTKKEVKEELEEHNICHSTIELELENEHCEDDKCNVKSIKAEHHHHH
jgi:cobalt-zinc-cadmium efflux system protein